MDRRSYLAGLGLLFGGGCSGDTAGAARDDPVRQVGEAYTLRENVRVRVRDVVTADRVVHDDAFGARTTLVSGDDHEFLLAAVSTTNLGTEEQFLPTVHAYRVLAADGEAVQRRPGLHDDETRIYEPVSGPYHGFRGVDPGRTVSGWMRFGVPSDRELRYLALDPGMRYGGLTIRWEL